MAKSACTPSLPLADDGVFPVRRVRVRRQPRSRGPAAANSAILEVRPGRHPVGTTRAPLTLNPESRHAVLGGVVVLEYHEACRLGGARPALPSAGPH